MKKLLIALSSLTTLTIAGNSIINNNYSATATNNINTNSLNTNDSPKTALFNDQYGLLNANPDKTPENNWISNQTKDNTIYSYDLGHVRDDYILSDGTKAKNAFIVDTDGSLNYKPTITEPDKSELDNSKEEMFRHRIVTTIKDNDNPYSCSVYDAAGHFTDQDGDNTWQYLQQGQAEPNIDISQVKNAENIAHNNAESEALGLYYIAKQYRAKINRIDLAVAKEIAATFIRNSSLKETLYNNPLIDQIITLIAKNDNVFKFILNMPFSIGPTYKNYAMNYIFDSNNHLIEVYYNHWNNNDNLSAHINASDFATAGDDGNYGYDWWWSNINTIMDWKKYANSWNDFTAIYPTFGFGLNSYLQVYNNKTGVARLGSFNDKTSVINNKQPWDLSVIENAYYDWNSPDYYKFWVEKDYGNSDLCWSQVGLAIYLWHDDQNIYYQASAIMAVCNVDIEYNNYDYKLDNCIFNNIMN